jgi:predicted nucleic acid-binding protein
LKFVVDASVAVKWFVPEEHEVAAKRLLSGANELVGPDFLTTEIMNALARKIRRGEIDGADAQAALEAATPRFLLYPAAPLVPRAWSIAIPYNRNAYDSLCFALALREDCPFVTADRRAYDALHDDFPTNILWVEDIPEPA